ncbi:hypothetical protein ACIA6T_20155 [Streptomyces sp. NPDC051740]|uniref:hypothetical protein n=1 Tax=Streptomyces sp. NPDC051740 TaxID=3365673 RepID=UPI003794DFC6
MRTSGLGCVIMIAGFVVFDAVREALLFDRRLVSAGYGRAVLFAAGGAFGDTVLRGRLGLGLLWAGAFSAVGPVVFWIRTRSRNHAR